MRIGVNHQAKFTPETGKTIKAHLAVYEEPAPTGSSVALRTLLALTVGILLFGAALVAKAPRRHRPRC